MTPNSQAKSQSAKLRQKAEEHVAKRAKSTASSTSSAANRAIHELEVHQVELELQNEELRQARAKLEIQNAKLRQASEELEATYDELYDFAPVGYFTLGHHSDIEKANLTGAGMLGQPRSRLRGRRFVSFVAPETLSSFNKFLQRVRGGFDKQSCMVTLMKGGNTPVSVYIEATGMGPDSNFRALVVDITTAEQARRALRGSEERLKMVLAASRMGVWECEYDTGHIYWSQECNKIFGVGSLSPKLDTLAQLLHPEDAPRIRLVISHALADGKQQSAECRIIRPDGQVVRISASCEVQCDEAAKPLRVVGIVQDISERKRAGKQGRQRDTHGRKRARAASKAGGRGTTRALKMQTNRGRSK